MVQDLSHCEISCQKRPNVILLDLRRVSDAVEYKEAFLMLDVCDTEVTGKGDRLRHKWKLDLLFIHRRRHDELTHRSKVDSWSINDSHIAVLFSIVACRRACHILESVLGEL